MPANVSERLRCGLVLLLAGLVFSLGPALPAKAGGPSPTHVPGIEVLLHERLDLLRGKRVGLVTNHTGVDRQLRSSIDLLAKHADFKLVALFGPEHGVRGDAQAGEPVADARDRKTGLPVHSLYGEHREPTSGRLRGIDVLVFDIQDIGARPYTYPYTLAGVLHAAKRAGIPVVVADRPNPIGGVRVEGPVLEPAFASFVGQFPIPLRHGMTIGELARLFNGAFGIGAQLHVVPVRGWRRDAPEPGDVLPWVPPSPNMPTPDTALVYPGMVLFEGTNLSEGRGTTRPFETVGAPWIDAEALATRMNALGLAGVRFRPTWFTPTFSRHAGVACAGVQLHVTDRDAFRPVRTAIALLKTIHDQHPEHFAFNGSEAPQADRPGSDMLFFDKLAGNRWIRRAILDGDSVDAIEARWQPTLPRFEALRQRYLLY